MMWRSMLYVPANMPKFLEKAQSRGADALVLDLEDSVPADRKAEAREILQRHWDNLLDGPSDLIVRTNAPMRSAIRDLEAVVQRGLSAIFLPKTHSRDAVNIMSETIAELEAERGLEAGSVRLIPMIETPAALEVVSEIAKADSRVCGLILGTEDFATACGMQPSPKNLRAARQQIVFAARAAGIAPYGMLDSVAAIADVDWSNRATQARNFGFSGATAIHPSAIAGLNAGFAPTEHQLIWAKRVIATMAKAAEAGKGAARLDGQMIDMPMQLRAQAYLHQQR